MRKRFKNDDEVVYLFDNRNKDKPIEIESYDEMYAEREWAKGQHRAIRAMKRVKQIGNRWKILNLDYYNRIVDGRQLSEWRFSDFAVFPSFLLYLPRYYFRIFIRFVWFCSAWPGKKFGFLELSVEEFYLTLTEIDRRHFVEVMKFFLSAGVIETGNINNIKRLKLDKYLAKLMFTFKLEDLYIFEKTKNQKFNRNLRDQCTFEKLDYDKEF